METKLIDFHNHFFPPGYEHAIVRASPPGQRARWKALAASLCDEDLLLRDIREGALEARVVNSSPALIGDHVGHETIVALNDALADLVARHPGRLYGLGSVDAYDGERSAREAERCIRELGLRGLFVDCARGELMIDAPEARPTLEAAAQLGVPVFVHPVAPQPLTARMAPYGLTGALYARGTANSAALIALLEGGVLSALPGLRVVVTALALGGIAMAAALSTRSLKQVFIDTNLVHPALIRASIDLLGAGNVLAGSDWPVNDTALRFSGLSNEEQEAIAAGNCRRLLGLNS